MDPKTKANIRKSIETYVQYVNQLLQKFIQEGKLQPINESYQKMVIVGELEYTSSGVGGRRMQGEGIVKKTWNPIEIMAISKNIEESNECKQFVSNIKELADTNFNEFNQLVNLNGRIISRILNKENIDEEIIIPLYQDIIGGTNSSIARVELIGLTLESKRIQLTPEIELRQVFKEDLEYETPAFPTQVKSPTFDIPSSIITITKELKSNEMAKLQYEIEKIILALQLTRIGSIKYIKYTTRSKTLKGLFGGMIGTMNTLSSNLRTYIKKDEEEEYIKKFQIIFNSLKKNDQKLKSEPLETAMEFFKESIVEQGKTPKKIAESIMSLEALFSNSTQELKFRLSTRISKIVGMINKKPTETMEIIKLAYDVRSTYAHGSKIGDKLTKKINKLTESIENLRNEIAEILRISILIMLQTKKTKEQLLELIDKSMITDNKELDIVINAIKT